MAIEISHRCAAGRPSLEEISSLDIVGFEALGVDLYTQTYT